jgi:hypothetical protein
LPEHVTSHAGLVQAIAPWQVWFVEQVISVLLVAVLVIGPAQLWLPVQLRMKVGPPVNEMVPEQLWLPLQSTVHVPPPWRTRGPLHAMFAEQSSTHELPAAHVTTPVVPAVMGPPGAQLPLLAASALPLSAGNALDGRPMPPMQSPAPHAPQLWWPPQPSLTTPQALPAPAHAVAWEMATQPPAPHCPATPPPPHVPAPHAPQLSWLPHPSSM